jgi:hypothetical protein
VRATVGAGRDGPDITTAGARRLFNLHAHASAAPCTTSAGRLAQGTQARAAAVTTPERATSRTAPVRRWGDATRIGTDPAPGHSAAERRQAEHCGPQAERHARPGQVARCWSRPARMRPPDRSSQQIAMSRYCQHCETPTTAARYAAPVRPDARSQRAHRLRGPRPGQTRPSASALQPSGRGWFAESADPGRRSRRVPVLFRRTRGRGRRGLACW